MPAEGLLHVWQLLVGGRTPGPFAQIKPQSERRDTEGTWEIECASLLIVGATIEC